MSFWDRQESISRLRWASPVATVTDVAYGITAHAEAIARRMRAGCAAKGSWFVPSATGESCVVWNAAIGAVRRAGAWVQAVPWLFRMPLGELAMPAGGGSVCQWASFLSLPQSLVLRRRFRMPVGELAYAPEYVLRFSPSAREASRSLPTSLSEAEHLRSPGDAATRCPATV